MLQKILAEHKLAAEQKLFLSCRKQRQRHDRTSFGFYQDYSTAKKKEQNGIAATGRPGRKSKADHFPGNTKRQGNALGNIHKKPEWILEEVGENLP